MGALDGPRDYVCWATGLAMIAIAVLSYLDMANFGFLEYVIGGLFIVGGVFGFLDAWSIGYGWQAIMYMIPFLFVIAMGIEPFNPIPYVSFVFEMIPEFFMNVVINGIVGLGLIIVAMTSQPM